MLSCIPQKLLATVMSQYYSIVLAEMGNIHDRATDGPSETVPGIVTMAVLLVSWSVYPSIANRGYFVYLTTVLV